MFSRSSEAIVHSLLRRTTANGPSHCTMSAMNPQAIFERLQCEAAAIVDDRMLGCHRTAPGRVSAVDLRLHLLAEPVDRRLCTTAAVRDAQRRQRHLDHAERAKDHRRIDMPHMGNAEGLAGEFADA